MSATELSVSLPRGRHRLHKETLAVRFLRGDGRARQLRFATVSVLCFGIQYVILTSLFGLGGVRPAWLCNALAFFISTQINCTITQRFTFADRWVGWRRFWWRFVPYNAVAAISLGLNTGGFAFAHFVETRLLTDHALMGQASVMLFGAQGAGAVTGAAWTYLVCKKKIFRKHQPRRNLVTRYEGLAEKPVGSVNGVAVGMPAYKELENLTETVTGVLAAFEAADIPCIVVIADDGGSDGTPELASQLCERYRGQVVVAHHQDQNGDPFNQGYGRAVRTALETAVLTGMERVMKVDADLQFRADDLVAAYLYGVEERAEAVLCHRVNRADPLVRKVNGKLWTWLSNLWIHTWERDVDCAVKVFWAPSLAQFQLVAQYGAMGAELTAWCKALKLHVVHFGVAHLPRPDQENQTGANIKVILGSFASLPVVYLNLAKHGYRWRLLQRLVRPRDVPAYVVTVAAMAISVIAFWHYYKEGVTINYPDAAAHLEITQRMIMSPTPGLAQLGTVWLPLPHLLSLWGAWNATLYYSGIAGSAVSMLSFVVSARYTYKLGALVSGRVLGGLVAAVVLLTNGNMLFMQSTPMTESLMIATIIAGVYYLTLWARTDDWRHLAASSFAMLLGCFTRYEAWFTVIPMVLVVFYIVWRKEGRAKAKLAMRFFGAVAGLAVPLWMLWGWIILHNPFDFQSGDFAKPSLWVAAGEPAIGHWDVAWRTYWYAMIDNLGRPVTYVMCVGAVFYLARNRFRPESLPPLVLGVYVPFFVYSLKTGQRPLHVNEINGSLYNVRFALVMVLAAGVFGGYLVSQVLSIRWSVVRRLAPAVAMATAVALVAGLAWGGTPSTLTEGITFRHSTEQVEDARTADWLRQHYQGGLVLMEGFSNVSVQFDSHIPTQKIIYEGSNKDALWKSALKYPYERKIKWIVMRRGPTPDEVYNALHASPELSHYWLALRGVDLLIYKLGPKPPTPVKASASANTRTEPFVPAMQIVIPKAPGSGHGQPAHQTRPGRPTRNQPRVGRTGTAAWYDGPAGRCHAPGQRSGGAILVINPRNNARVDCRVVANQPDSHGRVVVLARPDFARLGSLADGLVQVQVVPISKRRVARI